VTVIFVGKSPEFYPAIAGFLSCGLRIVMVDLSAAGEIDSGGSLTDNWAWFVERPWPGMWMEHVNGIVASLAAEFPGAPPGLMASPSMAKSALFAAGSASSLLASAAGWMISIFSPPTHGAQNSTSTFRKPAALRLRRRARGNWKEIVEWFKSQLAEKLR
jgi:hypothetical protein